MTDHNEESFENGDSGSPSSASKPRHQPGVKRACNDCRQQKVGSSHAIDDGFSACDSRW